MWRVQYFLFQFQSLYWNPKPQGTSRLVFATFDINVLLIVALKITVQSCFWSRTFPGGFITRDYLAIQSATFDKPLVVISFSFLKCVIFRSHGEVHNSIIRFLKRVLQENFDSPAMISTENHITSSRTLLILGVSTSLMTFALYSYTVWECVNLLRHRLSGCLYLGQQISLLISITGTVLGSAYWPQAIVV